ncbi:hypothetical protein [Cellulosimicrobium sp. I38E]|uniref:hypothetical protein n=1 Tax=Cellulosimicrobium sp. I38E TaxID=1393139 RepID=UPI000A663DB8|nr:hypothetical protein [Cellulosimicrobium sp. I38E]
MSVLQGLWGKVQEPKVVTFLHWIAYMVALGVGLSALVDPPSSVAGELGPVLTTIWAGFIILGGVLGVFATLPGVWWLERAAVIACITGLAVWVMVVVTLELTIPDGNRWPQAGALTMLALLLAVRWFRIRRYAYDPEPPVSRRHDDD